MADELARKIAEAKKKMFGDQQAFTGKIILLSKGDGEVRSRDPKIEVKKVSP